MSEIIRMQPFMKKDLEGVFVYDMPTDCKIDGMVYIILKKDTSYEEIDAFGGPQLINAMELHFLAADLPSIANGALLYVPANNGAQKEVLKSNLSEDGNELIVYVRAT